MKVISFESLGFMDVYDLHIDHDDHSFYCQNIPVHNSNLCQSRDGRKYYQKIDEINRADRPPIHFLCRSQLVPRTKEKDGTTLRASQFGAVPANENYTQWFNKQSPTFQKSVLKGKYSAFKDGRYKVSTLADVKGSLSLDEYKEGLFAYVNGELPS